MIENKNILPKNTDGNYHAYHEWYYLGKLDLRRTYKNGHVIGYAEWHTYETCRFYIK